MLVCLVPSPCIVIVCMSIYLSMKTNNSLRQIWWSLFAANAYVTIKMQYCWKIYISQVLSFRLIIWSLMLILLTFLLFVFRVWNLCLLNFLFLLLLSFYILMLLPFCTLRIWISSMTIVGMTSCYSLLFAA